MLKRYGADMEVMCMYNICNNQDMHNGSYQ